MIATVHIRLAFVLGIGLFYSRTFNVGERYTVVAGFFPGEACHLNSLNDRPVQRRKKTKWLHRVSLLLYIIVQREVTGV